MKKLTALVDNPGQAPASGRNQTKRAALRGYLLLSCLALSLLLVLLFCQTATKAEPKSGARAMVIGEVKRTLPGYRVFCPDMNKHEDGKFSAAHAKTHVNVLTWKSKKDTQPVSLVCIHALGLSAKAYADFGDTMSDRGIDTYAVDVRGFGEKRSERNFDRVDFKACFADLIAFLKHMKKAEPDKKLILVGESMGGAIALKLAGDDPKLVDGVICSAPAWQLYKIRKITMKGIADLCLLERTGFAADAVIRQATNCKDLQEYWRYGGNTKLKLSISEAFSYYCLMKTTPQNASRIENIPVMVIQGLHDRLSQPAASAKIFDFVNSHEKQFVIAASSEHLVLEEDQLSLQAVDLIDSWMHRLYGTVKVKQAEPQSVVVIDDSNLSPPDNKHVQSLKELARTGRVKTVATRTPL